MANISKTIPFNWLIDVSCPGNPSPNKGMGIASITFSPTGIASYTNLSGYNFQVRAGGIAGTTVCTVVSRNSAGVSFTDTINITVADPTPDATESGIIVSDPHA